MPGRESGPTPGPAHTAFLRQLPRVRAHAAFAFRHVRCPAARADFVAETVALAWRQFARLVRRGRHPERFVTTLALRCSQAVKAGRRLVRSEAARDVLSPVARARHGVVVVRLDGRDRLPAALRDALAADTRTPVPDQVAFRTDFPAWRAGLAPRDRRVLDALMVGGRTGEVARRFRLSPGRVSQLRLAFAAGWAAFHSHPPFTTDFE